MDVIIYLLFICLVIYIVITLLPVILPIVAIIVIAFSILIWYAKRKVRRHMEEYENEWNQQQEEYTTATIPIWIPMMSLMWNSQNGMMSNVC